jgi:hypothetical protein
LKIIGRGVVGVGCDATCRICTRQQLTQTVPSVAGDWIFKRC